MLVAAAWLVSLSVPAQDAGAKESMDPSDKVTAVYGVTADDYLIKQEASRGNARAKYRGGRSRQSLDLPDAFYFIGGVVFVLILMRVLVIFITAFEEKRKEEENQMASEHFNPD
ncbi:hypothetical protein [Pontiella agarivorans]|uniref:Uncharacterized protein n=1 Tax=Pontiella agarivorans TaxID=3038953 RepID=A0ABU5N0X4_9BACT|nr:hypothetical protein [Pontiella agarivorans]MDZ8120096.1 hypothetical protein [Pontiella agarivorans]